MKRKVKVNKEKYGENKLPTTIFAWMLGACTIVSGGTEYVGTKGFLQSYDMPIYLSVFISILVALVIEGGVIAPTMYIASQVRDIVDKKKKLKNGSALLIFLMAIPLSVFLVISFTVSKKNAKMTLKSIAPSYIPISDESDRQAADSKIAHYEKIADKERALVLSQYNQTKSDIEARAEAAAESHLSTARRYQALERTKGIKYTSKINQSEEKAGKARYAVLSELQKVTQAKDKRLAEIARQKDRAISAVNKSLSGKLSDMKSRNETGEDEYLSWIDTYARYISLFAGLACLLSVIVSIIIVLLEKESGIETEYVLPSDWEEPSVVSLWVRKAGEYSRAKMREVIDTTATRNTAAPTIPNTDIQSMMQRLENMIESIPTVSDIVRQVSEKIDQDKDRNHDNITTSPNTDKTDNATIAKTKIAKTKRQASLSVLPEVVCLSKSPFRCRVGNTDKDWSQTKDLFQKWYLRSQTGKPETRKINWDKWSHAKKELKGIVNFSEDGKVSKV